MSLVVEIKNAWIRYPQKNALQDVSLHLKEREALGIFGYNGAGKSTLLKVIIGLKRLDSGSLTVHGLQLTPETQRAIRRKTAYLPQCLDADIRMPISAWDVAMMGRYGKIGLFKRPSQSDREFVRTLLQQVDAERYANTPFGMLSGGERQRVMIAHALAQEPRLLLMDEPTNSLDLDFTRILCGIIRDAHSRYQLTSIIVSHDAEFLSDICTRILFMRDGRIAGELLPEDFRGAAMVGRRFCKELQ